MKKITAVIMLFVLVGFMIVTFVSCSEDSKKEVVTPENPDLIFEYSDPNIYEVENSPNSTVYDQETGVTLSFPEGGIGEVSISKILSGTETLIEGEGVKIKYSGDTPIDLVIDTSDGYYATVLEYGNFLGAFDDEIGGGKRWVEVPSSSKTGSKISFMLLMPSELSKLNAGKVWGSNDFFIAKLKPTDNIIIQRKAMSLQIGTFLNQFEAVLPSPLKERVIAKRKSKLLRVSIVSGGAFYSGFWMRILGKGLLYEPTVHLNLPPKNQQIAHELGHYLVHLLVGDDVDVVLENQGNLKDPHYVRDIIGREKLLEDLAYFAEYFLVNSGADSYDLTNPSVLLKDLSPKKNDFPSYEGFSSHFLGQLVRENSEIMDFKTRKIINIPVLNLSYGKVFEIISQGATGINALRENIGEYLGKDANKLPVIGHRMGWRYTVKGKLVNTDGEPMSNLSIEPILIADGTEYKGIDGNYTSDKEGNFEIEENVFPGNSILRVKLANGESKDMPININWDEPTNQIIDLGNLVLDKKEIKWVSILFFYTGTFQSDTPIITTQTRSHMLTGIAWNRDSQFDGNTIILSQDSTDSQYHTLTNFEVRFDDISNPSGIAGFYFDGIRDKLYDNTQDVYSVAGINLPFAAHEYGEGAGCNYYYKGNISQYLTQLNFLSTSKSGATYKLLSYETEGEITINVRYK